MNVKFSSITHTTTCLSALLFNICLKNWLQKWKIKVNETKSSHITFTLRKDNCPAISTNQTVLPQVESVKYLGLHFDRRLNWKVHITKKRKQTDLKAKEINWLIGKKSNLSIENEILVYKAVIKPIWTYGIELWDVSASPTQQLCREHNQKFSEP